MPYRVSPCEEKDFNINLANVFFDAFASQGVIINAIYPHNDTVEGREKSLQFFRKSIEKPSQRWLKLVDTDSDKPNEIIGVANFSVLDEKPKEIPETVVSGSVEGVENYFDSEEDREFGNEIVRDLLKKRYEYVSEGKPLVGLAKLAVAPHYQRRGVGSALLKEVVRTADEMKAECSLESTPPGVELYKRYGFDAKYMASFEVSEKFADRPKATLMIMHREAVK